MNLILKLILNLKRQMNTNQRNLVENPLIIFSHKVRDLNTILKVFHKGLTKSVLSFFITKEAGKYNTVTMDCKVIFSLTTQN